MDDITFKYSFINELSLDEISDLAYLTFGIFGCMRRNLYTAYNNGDSLPVAIAYKNEKAIGWAFLSPYYLNVENELTCMCFVDENYRRKGIGSRLVQNVKNRTDKNLSYGLCDNKLKFFIKNGITKLQW